VFFEIAERYPQIHSDAMYVDAMSLHMVATPSDWDVLVMENQFGDILSDLGAAIVGGLVMAPSAEIGDKHALFQPSHGTAPQLAGKNVANPTATILSAAMMLDWLGERHDDQAVRDAATMIETTVAGLLANGKLKTADQGRHGHNIGRCQNNLGRDSSESIQRRSLDLRNVSANLV